MKTRKNIDSSNLHPIIIRLVDTILAKKAFEQVMGPVDFFFFFVLFWGSGVISTVCHVAYAGVFSRCPVQTSWLVSFSVTYWISLTLVKLLVYLLVAQCLTGLSALRMVLWRRRKPHLQELASRFDHILRQHFLWHIDRCCHCRAASLGPECENCDARGWEYSWLHFYDDSRMYDWLHWRFDGVLQRMGVCSMCDSGNKLLWICAHYLHAVCVQWHSSNHWRFDDWQDRGIFVVLVDFQDLGNAFMIFMFTKDTWC